MSIWGGPRRRIKMVIIFMILLGLFSALIGLRASMGFIIVSGFLTTLCVPILSSSNQVIWQKKVAADVQGRVFAIRRTIVLATPLLPYIVLEVDPGILPSDAKYKGCEDVVVQDIWLGTENVGIRIPEGEISNWLIGEREIFHAEQDAMYEAGLASIPYQQTDDTLMGYFIELGGRTRLGGANVSETTGCRAERIGEAAS